MVVHKQQMENAEDVETLDDGDIWKTKKNAKLTSLDSQMFGMVGTCYKNARIHLYHIVLYESEAGRKEEEGQGGNGQQQ